MNWNERKDADVYKPLIDDALLRIASAVGADTDAIEGTLSEQSPDEETSQWRYANDILAEIRDDLVTDDFTGAAPQKWAKNLVDGSAGDNLNSMSCVETAADRDPDPMAFFKPIVLEYYPEESHECLRQEHYVDGTDADVIALWSREDRTSVCHAHMEGFWTLGEDVADWLEGYADEVEEELAT